MDNLSDLHPFLEVSGPDGQQFRVELSKERVTIGRFASFNDVALEPDPQQLITRKVHCLIERDAGYWWVLDNGSANGTFVQQKTTVQVVSGRVQLSEGDSIRILGKLIEGSDPLYWELTFHDPLRTKVFVSAPLVAYLEYDWIQARLFCISGSNRQEVRNLRPQEHKLVRYMYQRNRTNGNVPVMCTYEELLMAIWGEEPNHIDDDINHLVWELRKKLEPEPKRPQFLETVRGLGYRLIISK